MKKLLVAFALVAGLALVRPAPADAHFSLSIGLPGFGVYVQDPFPAPVVYAPPAYYRPPVAYYPPVPAYYRGYPRYRHRCHGPRYGGDRYGRGWDY